MLLLNVGDDYVVSPVKLLGIIVTNFSNMSLDVPTCGNMVRGPVTE